ncbi:transposase, partial [Bacillus wiedmannii]
NENINFNSVASEAGVAKATLYNHSDLRERIETLRQQQSQSLTQQQIKRKMNDNNKEALIESLKRKNKKLEEENKKLRKQLKVAYAEVYKKF